MTSNQTQTQTSNQPEGKEVDEKDLLLARLDTLESEAKTAFDEFEPAVSANSQAIRALKERVAATEKAAVEADSRILRIEKGMAERDAQIGHLIEVANDAQDSIRTLQQFRAANADCLAANKFEFLKPKSYINLFSSRKVVMTGEGFTTKRTPDAEKIGAAIVMVEGTRRGVKAAKGFIDSRKAEAEVEVETSDDDDDTLF